jgi:UPF0755 protein
VKRLAVALLLLAAAAGGAALYAVRQPYRGFQGELFLQVARGTTTRELARQLAAAGVVRHEWLFLAMRALRPQATLQAGEYRFSEPASAADVFGRLERGDIFYFDITIPEGSNIWEIARILEEQGVMGEADFLAAAADPAPIRDLDPDAQSLEGYLFPSTYRLSHSTTARELVGMMVEEFRKQWRTLQEKPDGAGARPLRETVTLASLVEKETGSAEERALVAGVFANRLRIGMRLACDPTVIYAALLSGKYRGAIHQSDLDRDHPYNTYRRAGLPPGPIANPGAAALAAAAHPAQTEYLYFVARPGGGGHVFSKTGAAHQRAVRDYRNGLSGQKAAR